MIKQNLPYFVPTFLSLSFFCISAFSQTNWPSWRGPEGNSVSYDKSLPTSWSEKENITWKVPISGDGASSPCIWENSIFLTSQDGEKLIGLKFDLKTGTNSWSKELGSGETIRDPLKGKPGDQRRRQKFHKLHNLASPSPVTNGKKVIFLFGNGDLACTDFNGNTIWKKNLQKEQGTFTIWWGYSNSPFIHENIVICTVMQDSLGDLEGERRKASLSHTILIPAKKFGRHFAKLLQPLNPVTHTPHLFIIKPRIKTKSL